MSLNLSPKSMPMHSIPPDSVAPPTAGDDADDFLRARLMLMAELEASLHRSRKALLALDLCGIESGTREQVRLVRDLVPLFRKAKALPAGSRAEGEKREGKKGEDEPGLAGDGSELLEACQLSEGRVLEAARLQAALLTRARSKMRVMANMLTGPATIYGPLSARRFDGRALLGGNRI
jgi:hypothetical protein